MSRIEEPDFRLLSRERPNQERVAALERQLAEAQRCDDCADSPEDIRLPAGYRCYFCDKRFCGPHAKTHFKDGITTAAALTEATRKLEAVEEWSDNLKAMAQEFGDLRALDRILEGE